MSSLDPVKTKVAEVAIRKMLRGDSYFSISTVDQLLDMLNIPADPEIYRILRPLHCVHWNEMDGELREQVVLLLAHLFQGEAMPTFAGVIANEQGNQKRIARH